MIPRQRVTRIVSDVLVARSIGTVMKKFVTPRSNGVCNADRAYARAASKRCNGLLRAHDIATHDTVTRASETRCDHQPPCAFATPGCGEFEQAVGRDSILDDAVPSNENAADPTAFIRGGAKEMTATDPIDLIWTGAPQRAYFPVAARGQ